MPDLEFVLFLITFSAKRRHLETMKPPKSLAYPKSRGKIMLIAFLNSFIQAEFHSDIILPQEKLLHPREYWMCLCVLDCKTGCLRIPGIERDMNKIEI